MGVDWKEMKEVDYVRYEEWVEEKVMGVVVRKEGVKEFMKRGEVKEEWEILEELEIRMWVMERVVILRRLLSWVRRWLRNGRVECWDEVGEFWVE